MKLPEKLITRILIAAASMAVYGLFFLFAYPYLGMGAAILNILPSSVFGWFLGVRGSLAYGLLAFPVNMLLFLAVGDPEATKFATHLFGTGIFTLESLGIAWIMGLNQRVYKQTRELQKEIERRVQAENHLIEAQRIAHFGNWSFDLSTGAVNSASAELYRICGVNPKRFSGKLSDILDIVNPDDRDRAESRIHKFLKNRQPYSADYRIIRPNGEERIVRIQVEAVFDSYGTPVEGVGTALDITALRQAEAARLEMERNLLQTRKLDSLGVIAGGIAHNFNNLLTGIIGYLELGKMNLPKQSPVGDDIEQAMQGCYRAANLTRQMLAYTGKGIFALKQIDLNSVVCDSADLIRTTTGENTTIHTSTTPNLPFVLGDESQVRHVVMDLLINAFESLGGNAGVITLGTGTQVCDNAYLYRSKLAEKPEAGLFVYVDVSDTGCGMDEETQELLFDPFFTTKFMGRGMGMAAVIGIIRAHKGAILLDSKLGEGTTFRLLFPVRNIRSMDQANPGRIEVPEALPCV
jgi:PAS domain S-box-containing protein